MTSVGYWLDSCPVRRRVLIDKCASGCLRKPQQATKCYNNYNNIVYSMCACAVHSCMGRKDKMMSKTGHVKTQGMESCSNAICRLIPTENPIAKHVQAQRATWQSVVKQPCNFMSGDDMLALK